MIDDAVDEAISEAIGDRIGDRISEAIGDPVAAGAAESAQGLMREGLRARGFGTTRKKSRPPHDRWLAS
ncbi:hypothetical protein ACIRPT_19705 [Streptomyces sp. NPDC101227]|uniref:hypothetical protein n=1 Tax=Streptomyces sp. NPDC101227 TaxID=3366136 RepID=UPI003809F4BD